MLVLIDFENVLTIGRQTISSHTCVRYCDMVLLALPADVMELADMQDLGSCAYFGSRNPENRWKYWIVASREVPVLASSLMEFSYFSKE